MGYQSRVYSSSSVIPFLGCAPLTHSSLPQRTLPSQGGSIWSISPNPSSTLLALGCEDGSVRIVSLENDSFIHLRRLDRVRCRVLSLAWGPPTPRTASQRTDESDSSDEDENDWSDSWLVAGCSDSCLRKWDVTTGRVLERMGTDKLKGEKTLVWTVGVLGYVFEYLCRRQFRLLRNF